MRLIDRMARVGLRLGLMRASTALLETIGRSSGERRVIPVTNGLDGDVFWIVTERGRRAAYVRNLQADPRVRVRAGARWRSGTARIVDEDPEATLERIARLHPAAASNTRIVRRVSIELLVIRIDLDPA